MDLNQLVEQCKLGNREAFSTIYNDYYGRMLRVVLHYVNDSEIARDIVHDGFVIIFTSIQTLKKPQRLEAWMKRIVTNLSLDYLKSSHDVLLKADAQTYSQVQEQDEMVEDMISLDELMNLIDRLPEGYRRIFRLSVLDGLTHAQIAEKLHIAPNSSSSQLFHAKQLLRKMIVNYRARVIAIFLLLLIPFSYIFISKRNMFDNQLSKDRKQKHLSPNTILNKLPENQYAEKKNAKEHTIVTPRVRSYFCRKSLPDIFSSQQEPVHYIAKIDTLSFSDTSRIGIKPIMDIVMTDSLIHDTISSRIFHSKHRDGMLLGLNSVTEQAATKFLPKLLESMSLPSDVTHIAIDNWQDYRAELINTGGCGMNSSEYNALLKISQSNSGKIIEKKNFEKPLTFTLHLHVPITDHFGLESGLQYTRHTTNITAGEGSYIQEKQRVHYIGIPMNAVYTIARYKRFSFYGSLGVTLDIPFKASSKIDYIVNGISEYSKDGIISKPYWQWSVGSGLGISYKLIPHTEFFFNPCIHYYFSSGSATETLWQNKSWQIAWPIGIRFTY
jgi:RNA polymerase sigma factor (sigma-70 family)